MCVSIINEAGAKNYMRETLLMFRKDSRYPADTLRSFQRYHGWLKDYEIVDQQLVLKAKPVTGNPGLKAVEKAIDEVVKTTPTPVRRKRTVKAA